LAKKKQPSILREVKETKLLEIDYSKNKVISFSQYQIFEQCPHKWALLYRDGHYKSEFSIHMTFGTAMHETLQYYLKVMYEVSVAAADREDIIQLFNENLRNQYKQDYEKNNKVHFSSATELREFFNDGVAIINWFKKNKSKYFSKRNWHLVGIELPIILQPHPDYPNVLYKGLLDLVLYNENTRNIKIIDIKTSTRGWRQKEKGDEVKNSQLILYKKFFAQQFDYPIENIDIEYFILKRKINEESEYPDRRIQTHKPTSGKIKINQATNKLNTFIELAFSKESTYNEHQQEARPSKWNCQYCVFKDRKDLCSFNQ
jgi:hypothetical protein